MDVEVKLFVGVELAWVGCPIGLGLREECGSVQGLSDWGYIHILYVLYLFLNV